MSGLAYKVIFFKVLQFLIECLHNYQLLPQDFADSLASHLSVTLTSCLFVLVMTRMFFTGSIECLTPPEWPEPWEKAAEAACFTEGTYAVPRHGAAANRTSGDGVTEFPVKLPQDYYYWIPYILIGVAVILKAPDFFWHYVCDLHPKKPLETLKAFAFLVGNQQAIGCSADDDKGRLRIASCVERRRWTDLLARHLMSRNELVNFDTWHLFALYMAFKLLRLAALLGALVYLRAAFGLESVLFGGRMAMDSWRGVPWEETDRFPRWAYCDVHAKFVGQWTTRVVQCALPVNMLVERVVAFLWFWLVCCAAVSAYSVVAWCVKMLPARRRDFARGFLDVLIASSAGAGRMKMTRRRATRELAAPDRQFMLRLVEDRLGLAAAYLAMECMVTEQRRVVTV